MYRYQIFCLIVMSTTCFGGKSGESKLYTYEDYKKEVEVLDKSIDTSKNKVGSEIFWEAFYKVQKEMSFLEKNNDVCSYCYSMGNVQKCAVCEQEYNKLFYAMMIPLYKKYYREYVESQNIQKKQ